MTLVVPHAVARDYQPPPTDENGFTYSEAKERVGRRDLGSSTCEFNE